MYDFSQILIDRKLNVNFYFIVTIILTNHYIDFFNYFNFSLMWFEFKLQIIKIQII